MLNNFQVGDLITTYHKGYHIITKIERRFYGNDAVRWGKILGEEYSPLVHYEMYADGNFKIAKKRKKNSCDMVYCQKVDVKFINKTKEELLNKIKALENMYLGFIGAEHK